MRHLSNYIALSLLAAAFAGCSSTDTGSTSTSSSGGQDPLTGPLAVLQSKIKPLATACAYDSVDTLGVTVTLAANEVAVISKRAVDSALLVNGATCVDVVPTTPVTALTSKLKSIAITGPAASAETVLFDIRNGTYALAGASSGGITVDLGGGNDEVAILGSTAADKLGCKVSSTKDAVGLKSATSADITFTTAITKLTVDMNAGDDSFTQGDCTTAMTIYGGEGKDTIVATTEPADPTTLVADTFVGGAGLDTISYAARTLPVEITPDGATASGALVTAALGDEGDLVSEFETITGGAGADKLHGGAEAGITLYTLNGGNGDDVMDSVSAHSVTFNGQAGTDTVDYSGRGVAVAVNMGDGKALDGIPATDTDNVGKDVENLIGTIGNDSITGNALNNTFYPGSGNDTVNGGDGDDTLMADDDVGGNDDGDDTFIGGKGIDTVDYSARTVAGVTVTMDGVVTNGVLTGTPSGTCAYTIGTQGGAAPVWAIAAEADVIGADVENIVGTALEDHLIGNALDNAIYGLGAQDYLEGKAGNDQLDANKYATTGGKGYDCNPATLKCIVTHADCDCATHALTATCPHTSSAVGGTLIDCGGDTMDVASCQAGVLSSPGVATDNFTACWKVQK